MGTFAFKALDLAGTSTRGELEADDKQSVASQLAGVIEPQHILVAFPPCRGRVLSKHQLYSIPAELIQRRVPDIARRGRVRQVAGDQLVAAASGVSGDIVAGGLEQCVSGGANSAARSGNEDVHPRALSAANSSLRGANATKPPSH